MSPFSQVQSSFCSPSAARATLRIPKITRKNTVFSASINHQSIWVIWLLYYKTICFSIRQLYNIYGTPNDKPSSISISYWECALFGMIQRQPIMVGDWNCSWDGLKAARPRFTSTSSLLLCFLDGGPFFPPNARRDHKSNLKKKTQKETRKKHHV